MCVELRYLSSGGLATEDEASLLLYGRSHDGATRPSFVSLSDGAPRHTSHVTGGGKSPSTRRSRSYAGSAGLGGPTVQQLVLMPESAVIAPDPGSVSAFDGMFKQGGGQGGSSQEGGAGCGARGCHGRSGCS